MEKQTRMNKYKDLRNEMKEEVAIENQYQEDNFDDEDDFLAFLPREKQPVNEDTLKEPLNYENLNNEDEDLRQAINEAKTQIGKEKYNTRLDILNHIKKDEDPEYEPVHGPKSGFEESQKKMSLLEKLAAMSPEEDAEELRKFQEMTSADLTKEINKRKINEKEKTKEVTEETIETKNLVIEKEVQQEKKQPKETDDSKLTKVLNYVIIIFMIISIILLFFIIKQFID